MQTQQRKASSWLTPVYIKRVCYNSPWLFTLLFNLRSPRFRFNTLWLVAQRCRESTKRTG